MYLRAPVVQISHIYTNVKHNFLLSVLHLAFIFCEKSNKIRSYCLIELVFIPYWRVYQMLGFMFQNATGLTHLHTIKL